MYVLVFFINFIILRLLWNKIKSIEHALPSSTIMRGSWQIWLRLRERKSPIWIVSYSAQCRPQIPTLKICQLHSICMFIFLLEFAVQWFSILKIAIIEIYFGFYLKTCLRVYIMKFIQNCEELIFCTKCIRAAYL